MSRRLSSLSFAIVMILTVLTVIPPVSANHFPPPGAGNWVINIQDTWSAATLTVNGNLIINNGGVLTLNQGSTLTVNGNIAVNLGGALNLDQSTLNLPSAGAFRRFDDWGSVNITNNALVRSNGPNRWIFPNYASSALTIDNSEIRDCGVPDHELGITVFTNSATITNNDIHDCIVGIDAIGSKPVIKTNDIHNNYWHGIRAFQNAAPSITNQNTIRLNGLTWFGANGIDFFASGGTVDDNQITQNGNGGGENGINILDGSPTITNNDITNQPNGFGIIVAGKSSPVIRGNTITGNDGGFGVTVGATPTIDNNDISSTTGTPTGYYDGASAGTLSNNRIDGDNSDTLVVAGSSSPVITGGPRGYVDHTNGWGDAVQASGFSVLDVTALPTTSNNGGYNVFTGVTGTIDDSTVTANGWTGLYLADSANITVTNVSFRGALGIWAEDRGRGTIQDSSVYVNNGHAVTMINFADLTLTNDKLITTGGGSDAINMNDFSTVRVDRSTLVSQFDDGIWADTRNTITVTDSTINAQDSGVNLQNTNDLWLTRTPVQSNFGRALFTNFDNNAWVDRSNLATNTSDGIATSSSSTWVVNSTVGRGAGQQSVQFDPSWSQRTNYVDMLNVTFDPTAVTFVDTWGLLNVSWFADVYVVWNGSLLPVPGANLSISNRTAVAWWNRVTPPSGGWDWMVFRDFSQDMATKTLHNDWRFDADKGFLSGTKTVTVDKSMTGSNRIEVLLNDPSPPGVSITTPLDGALLNTSMVTVSGTALDLDSGVRDVLVAVDTGSFSSTGGGASWTTQLKLTDGLHQLTAQAQNFAGLFSSFSIVKITVDTTPPEVAFTTPVNDALLNTANVTVEGTVDDTAPTTVVLLDGQPVVNGGNGSWSANVILVDGSHTLRATATDLAGNTGWADLNLTIDTVPPLLIVLSPDDGSQIPMVLQRFIGQVEVGADLVLSLNGAPPVVVATTNGIFSLDITLIDGKNTVNFTATDAAGNTATVTRAITARPNPPVITVTWPANGMLLNSTTGKVAGTSDADNLTLNTRMVSIDANGDWSMDWTFTEGANVLELLGKDRFGRSTVVTVVVTVDTTPPLLIVQKPNDGFITRDTNVSFAGQTEPGATVTLDGIAVAVDADGHFAATPSLAEGAHKVMVVATDAAHNSATVNRSILVDRTPPPLSIITPAEGRRTSDEKVTFTGTTEPGAFVTVEGKPAVVDATGNWTISIKLLDGRNGYEVKAVDAAGNEAKDNRNVEKTGILGISSAGGPPLWLYIVIGIIIGAVPLLLYIMSRKKQKPAESFLPADGGAGRGGDAGGMGGGGSVAEEPMARPAEPVSSTRAPSAQPAGSPAAGPSPDVGGGGSSGGGGGTTAHAEAPSPGTESASAPAAVSPVAAPAPAPAPAVESKAAASEAPPKDADQQLDDLLKKLG